MDKYRLACAEYAKWSAEIKRLTMKIGEALEGCTILTSDGKHQHLTDAYMVNRGDDDRLYHVNHDGNVAEYLQEKCRHCLFAHIAIQKRKVARQKFGIAKRRILQLGRAECPAK